MMMDIEDLRNALRNNEICNMQGSWAEHCTGILDTGMNYVAFESMGQSLVKYENFVLWSDAVVCADSMARAYNAIYQGPVQWGDANIIERVS